MGVLDPGRPLAPGAPDAPNRLRAGLAAHPSADRGHGLVSQIGREIAAPLTSAMERINALLATGTIDRRGLRALRDEVEAARQVGMVGQQLDRFASGRLRLAPERLPLAGLVAGLLAHRNREIQARGIGIETALDSAEVVVDPSLLSSLLNTLLDWALANAASTIELRLDVNGWPVQARLSCRFAYRASETPSDGAPPGSALSDAVAPRLDSLLWRLLEQTAWTLGVVIDRRDGARFTEATIEFPDAVAAFADGMSAVELDDGFSPSSNSQPLAGSHVLVVASRREVRVQVRDALRNMSLIIDFVNTVAEAASFCREGLPHAVIVESIQTGERFDRLQRELTAEAPDLVFIEIIEEGTTFELSGYGDSTIARVGRGVIESSLPAALLFELSKGQ